MRRVTNMLCSIVVAFLHQNVLLLQQKDVPLHQLQQKNSKSLRFYIALFATLQLCILLALQHGNYVTETCCNVIVLACRCSAMLQHNKGTHKHRGKAAKRQWNTAIKEYSYN